MGRSSPVCSRYAASTWTVPELFAAISTTVRLALSASSWLWLERLSATEYQPLWPPAAIASTSGAPVLKVTVSLRSVAAAVSPWIQSLYVAPGSKTIALVPNWRRVQTPSWSVERLSVPARGSNGARTPSSSTL